MTEFKERRAEDSSKEEENHERCKGNV